MSSDTHPAMMAKRLRKRASLAAALLCLSAVPAHAASFSCAKASSPPEKAICADAGLSLQDEQLAAAFQAVKKLLSDPGAAELQADQREWVKWLRARCPGKATKIVPCLTEEYTRRLEQLEKGTAQMPGILFFPRLKVLIAPGLTHPGKLWSGPVRLA